MSRITKEDIDQLAEMAHLEFTEDEKSNLIEQLEEVLVAVDRLKSLDTEGVPPTPYGMEQHNVLRADENRPSLDREKVLQNAPQPQDGFFRVPRIME